MRIAIIGNQCAGKTTMSDKLVEAINANYTGGALVEVVKFAGPLYKCLEAHGQDKHRRYMQEEADLAKRHFGEMVLVEQFEKTVRAMDDGVPIICDDVRRTYEMGVCALLGFTVVYVEAPVEQRKARAMAQGLEFIEDHNSETEVPKLKKYANVIIDNSDGSKVIDGFVADVVKEMNKASDDTFDAMDVAANG